ncbi:hypothetical protein HBA54_28075 [Pelagibius litoralis]|uniref:Uncharacterized protein n=1 Tax=Pelagibius litoralis TaxID=374515 RepID=A0A967KGS2_9PROT|nr:hypothetical protein [Pelagibius litoralis]NIA72450.1 hypothetical protein [Pelagibius litoralis]
MKKKTINAVISKKMRGWWDSIEDESLRERVQKETVVTGGCIASMLLGEDISDFDVYLGKQETARDLAEYYVKRFKSKRANGIPLDISVRPGTDRVEIVVQSAGVASEEGAEADYQYFEDRPPEEAQTYVSEVMDDPAEIEDQHEETKTAAWAEADGELYRPVFLSTNAITLSHKVQVIVRFFGTPEEIHANYDFIHCTNYWTKSTGVVLNQPALEALLAKELRYVGSRYPICSAIRTRKFVKRGWTINAGQFVKMAFQIGELDLKDLSVLRDQLTGVDVAYFLEVIDKLQEKDKERVDGAYLLEIIDRLF